MPDTPTDALAVAREVLAAEKNLAELREQHLVPSSTGFRQRHEPDKYAEGGSWAIWEAEFALERLLRSAGPVLALAVQHYEATLRGRKAA